MQFKWDDLFFIITRDGELISEIHAFNLTDLN